MVFNPLNEELDRLKENIGTGKNIECKVKEVEFPKSLDDILQKSDWVMVSSSATVEGDLSFYVSSITDDSSQNTWTKNIKEATTFNAVAAKQVQGRFSNYGRRNYYAAQLP